MKIFNRICLKDYKLVAENGDALELERGQEYTTSPDREDGTCVVFSRYWAPVPVEIFAGAIPFTE